MFFRQLSASVIVTIIIVLCVVLQNAKVWGGQSPPSPSEVASVVNNDWNNRDFNDLGSYITNLYSSFPNYIPAILAASFHDAVYEGQLSDAMQKVNQVKQWVEQYPEGVSDEFTFQLGMVEWGLHSEIETYARHSIPETQLQPDPNAVRDACGQDPFPPIKILEYCDFALIWNDPNWEYRKKITIQNANVDSNLENFPLYVKISSDPNIGAHAQADGDDIRFTLADGVTLLNHEEEAFSIASGSATGHFWVKIPTVYSSHTTDIFMYYGNPAASDGQNAASVWSAVGVAGVWHLGESSGDAIDSTSNGYNLTNSGATQGQTGKVGNCYTFEQANYDKLQLNNAVVSSMPVTLYCWVNLNSVTVNNYMMPVQIADKDIAGPYWGIMINYNVSGRVLAHPYSIPAEAIATHNISAGDWHQLVAVFNAQNSRSCYVDGGNKGTNADTLSYSYTMDRLTIGAAGDSTPAWYCDGSIDEVRIYNRALSDTEVKFSYHNQNESDNELTWAAEEAQLN